MIQEQSSCSFHFDCRAKFFLLFEQLFFAHGMKLGDFGQFD
jgi:hypothetical protein